MQSDADFIQQVKQRKTTLIKEKNQLKWQVSRKDLPAEKKPELQAQLELAKRAVADHMMSTDYIKMRKMTLQNSRKQYRDRIKQGLAILAAHAALPQVEQPLLAQPPPATK